MSLIGDERGGNAGMRESGKVGCKFESVEC